MTSAAPVTSFPNRAVRLPSVDKVLLEAGKTYIIGGSRFTNQYKSASGIPGLFDYTIGQWIAGSEEQKLTRELVLMLHARIAPAPSIDPLIGESL